ncbi:MAG: SDR family NAD(P)-dependent oxidoreductase [Cellvibrionaceae bacterium]
MNLETPFNLTNKVALVTGGNGGIGLGFAKALANSGAKVCIWGTNENKNTTALEELQKSGSHVEAFKCDVSNSSEVDKVFAKTIDVFGRIDTCIANAGVGAGRNASFQDFTDEEWKRVTNVNLDGLFYTLRAAGRHMVDRAKQGDAGGRLIGTSSLGALCGMAKAEHYSGTKGAVISIMQSLAVEYGRYGITANSILPGHIHTGMTDKIYQNEKFVNAIMPRLPIRRWGKPEDFGGIAVYLASDASSYHTGDSFLIDGGFFIN